MERFPTDHLPALIRKTGWEWRGDFFDPEIPLAVELHFRFWNERLERLRAPGVSEFWPRRMAREVAGVQMGALSPVDASGFPPLRLHLFLKHIVQGSGRPFHIYEIARFLDARANDGDFWRQWQSLYDPELRRLASVHVPPGARVVRMPRWSRLRRKKSNACPASTAALVRRILRSPAQRIFFPPRQGRIVAAPEPARFAVGQVGGGAGAGLLPLNLPGPVDAIHLPESELTIRRRLLTRVRYLRHVARRASAPYAGPCRPQCGARPVHWKPWW